MSLWWEGFLKQVGFKPGVAEKELWKRRMVNQQGETDAGKGKSKTEKSVRIDREKREVDSRDKIKHIETYDLLYRERQWSRTSARVLHICRPI